MHKANLWSVAIPQERRNSGLAYPGTEQLPFLLLCPNDHELCAFGDVFRTASTDSGMKFWLTNVSSNVLFGKRSPKLFKTIEMCQLQYVTELVFQSNATCKKCNASGPRF
mmetsp:Transcript_21894/g.37278  ORF Transcript_21894/g.37278 Transcript_21894/m.37278 type:complete len:110 (+) Transcript_21894:95-424(+)